MSDRTSQLTSPDTTKPQDRRRTFRRASSSSAWCENHPSKRTPVRLHRVRKGPDVRQPIPSTTKMDARRPRHMFLFCLRVLLLVCVIGSYCLYSCSWSIRTDSFPEKVLNRITFRKLWLDHNLLKTWGEVPARYCGGYNSVTHLHTKHGKRLPPTTLRFDRLLPKIET